MARKGRLAHLFHLPPRSELETFCLFLASLSCSLIAASHIPSNPVPFAGRIRIEDDKHENETEMMRN